MTEENEIDFDINSIHSDIHLHLFSFHTLGKCPYLLYI